MEEKKIALFLADFDQQVLQIQKIYDILDSRFNALARKKVAPESVESSGYWLHNLFCAYEDLFKIVSAFWENSFGNDSAFHRNLIRRMLLNIEGVRPALLTEKSFKHLDELRGFRHVFRHAYSYGLENERVGRLLKKVLTEKKSVLGDLNAFRKIIAFLLAKDT